ncbi:MAG TPA: hypothetical protein VHC97_11555 [Thermoanaerobaculia bacterium]|nr:hypothetical protein [Thermoanaerobaculia bacterium]
MCVFRRLPVLAWLVWALLAMASPALAEARAPIELLAPRPGAALAAGAEAELEWAPLEPFDRFPKVEEWEAFLSLDGGATWPVRITPHLDQDLRRVRWQVPPVPTPDARILLRFGDEHQETAVELPVRFSIAASPVLLGESFALARRAAGPGEPALPGDAGAVAWVEGSRRGGSLRQVVAPERLSLRERLAPPAARAPSAVLAAAPAPPEAPALAPANGRRAAVSEGRRTALSQAGTGPAPPGDILLRIQRQNE